MKKEPLQTNPACSNYYHLPDDKLSNEAVVNSPPELFKYFKINETTQTCASKKTEDSRSKCFQRFLDLDKKLNLELNQNK